MRHPRMMPMPLRVALVGLLAVGLAGCSGSSSTSSSSTSGGGGLSFGGHVGANGTSASGNVSVGYGTSSSSNHTTNTTGTWHTETRHGNVSGLAYVVGGPSASTTFSVPPGAVKMLLNLTVDGDPLVLQVSDPDCSSSSCANQTTSDSGGKGQMTLMHPKQGTWSAVLKPSQMAGLKDSEYTLTIAVQTP